MNWADISNDDDFIAELTYLSAIEGGRTVAAYSGYRPGIKFPFLNMQTSGRQTFLNKEFANPGDIVLTAIKIVSTQHYVCKLEEGMAFDFREGSTIIGTGRIIQILNDKLKKPAPNDAC